MRIIILPLKIILRGITNEIPSRILFVLYSDKVKDPLSSQGRDKTLREFLALSPKGYKPNRNISITIWRKRLIW
jgi:hypothetical protein